MNTLPIFLIAFYVLEEKHQRETRWDSRLVAKYYQRIRKVALESAFTDQGIFLRKTHEKVWMGGKWFVNEEKVYRFVVRQWGDRFGYFFLEMAGPSWHSVTADLLDSQDRITWSDHFTATPLSITENLPDEEMALRNLCCRFNISIWRAYMAEKKYGQFRVWLNHLYWKAFNYIKFDLLRKGSEELPF